MHLFDIAEIKIYAKNLLHYLFVVYLYVAISQLSEQLVDCYGFNFFYDFAH